MINQQLLDYIQQQLKQPNSNRAEIEGELKAAGWQKQDVDEALNSLLKTKQAPISSSQPLVEESVINHNEDSKLSASSFRSRKKIVYIVCGVILGLLIIGGGVMAYFSYFPTPDIVIKKMLGNLATVKSGQYSGETQLNFDLKNLVPSSTDSILLGQTLEPAPASTDTDKKNANFIVNYSGSGDFHDSNNIQNSLALNLKASNTPIGDLNLGLEARAVNKMFYLQMTDLPSLGFFDISFLENKWIEINPASSNNQFGLMELKVPEVNLTPEQIVAIKLAAQKAELLQITENMPSEKISGLDMYHYKFIIDKEALKNFLIASAKITNDKTLTEEEINNFDKEFSSLESPTGEIWIGKDDFLPYKISLAYTVKEGDNLKTSGTVNFSLLLSNLNQPFKVEIPSPIQSIEEIISEFMLGLQTPESIGSSSTETSFDLMPDDSYLFLPENILVFNVSPYIYTVSEV